MISCIWTRRVHISGSFFSFRDYFKSNMLPILRDAIVDLAEHMPKDPIGHFADYLFKNAHRVPREARGDI